MPTTWPVCWALTENAAAEFTNPLRFTVKEIRHIEPAELGEELYDKLFGEDVVKDEEAFRGKVEEDLRRIFDRDGDRVFRRKFVEDVVDKLNPPLPEDFLKRWIRVANDKPITAEEIEAEFAEYAKGIKWQVIQNHIIDEHSIEVDWRRDQSRGRQRHQGTVRPIWDSTGGRAARPHGGADDERPERRCAGWPNRSTRRKAIDKLRELAKIKEKEVSHEEWMEIVRSL